MESVETMNEPDAVIVHPHPVEVREKPPSPFLFGLVLLAVGCIGFSPWLIVKMARENPPVHAADMTSPNNWQVDAKWHHSRLMQDRLNFLSQSHLALEMQRQRKFEKAAKMYTALLASPDSREANYLARGKCYLMLNRFDLAVSDFTNAIGLDPGDSDAYMARSAAYRQLGQIERAQADMAQGMKLNK